MIAEKKALMKGKEEVRVPEWFYKEIDCGCCGITIAGFMLVANVLCCVFHLILAIIAVSAAVSGGGGLSTPRLQVFLTELVWNANSTNALTPVNVPQEGLYLAWMTLWFFLLSALAHGIIVLGNWRQCYYGRDDPSARKVTRWSGWYLIWIHEARQPLRWAEYSISASLMIITISVASGVAHVYQVTFIFVLMWATMMFGYYAERLSRPESLGDKRPQRWAINSDSEKDSLIPAVIQRLAPHLWGYVCYITVWAVLMHSFFYNVSLGNDAEGGGGGGGPPTFVYIIVVGQLVVFSAFGVTQFWNLVREDGPYWYWRGETSYLFLSLFSKGLLGMTLVANVLLYSSVDEAVMQAD